jgi:hypothetical protein
MTRHSKPVISTIINTTALALTSFGVQDIIQKNYFGFTAIMFGMALEFFKYWGMKKKMW